MDTVHVTLLGHRPRPRRGAPHPGRVGRDVTWHDWVPIAGLARLVSEHDVCLGIFGASEKALGVVPTKVYQGAAAGCVVVTSDTAPQRRTLGAAAVLVRPGDDAALRPMSSPALPTHPARSPASAPPLLAEGRHMLLLSARRPLIHRLAGRELPRHARVRGPSIRIHPEDPDEPTMGGRRPPPLAIRARLRYDVVARILDGLAPRTVLEIGCGQGAVAARLASRAEYVGVEPDEESFGIARQRVSPRGGTVVNGTIDNLEPGRTFDLACAFEVLQHIEDDVTALSQWTQRLGPRRTRPTVGSCRRGAIRTVGRARRSFPPL